MQNARLGENYNSSANPPKVDAKFTFLVFSNIEDEFLKDFLEFFHDCHESGYLSVNEIRMHSFSVSILSMIVEYFGNPLIVFASNLFDEFGLL